MNASTNYSQYTLWLLPLAVSLLVFFTSNWYAPGDPAMSVMSDSYSYIEIAEAYPGLPDYFEHLDREKGIYHHNQRLVFPWLVGALSTTTGVALTTTFRVVSFSLITVFFYLLIFLFKFFEVEEKGCYVGTFVVAFNPYTFRLYSAFPYMVTDITFMVSVVIVLIGLKKSSTWLIVAGAILSVLARQTALVLIPGVFAWIFISTSWSSYNSLYKGVSVFLFSGIVAVGYIVTGSIADAISQPSYNLEVLMGLFVKMKEGISLDMWMKFIGRIVVTFGLLTSCISPLMSKNISKKFEENKFLYGLGLIGLGIIAQPILAGPSGNVHRLSSLALPAFALMGVFLVTIWSKIGIHYILLVFVISFLSSLHHIYSLVGPRYSLKEEFVYGSFSLFGIALVCSCLYRKHIYGNKT